MFRPSRRSIFKLTAIAAVATLAAHCNRAEAKPHDFVPTDPIGVIDPPVASPNKARIEIVFAIDCSGSMGPVIDSAKRKIWTIVNEVARAKPSPALRIGLLGYGDADHTFRSFDLSDDLDKVYEHLMTFHDEGWSEEYVGLSIRKATREMSWSKTPRHGAPVMQAIYVVGNETARQGPPQFDYAKTTPLALKNNINVNAIYCGDAGGQETWREFARLGEGKYMEIAGDGGTISIPTPYDDELSRLGVSLNGTYLAYGRMGYAGAANQAAQDSNSAKMQNGAERAAAKAAPQYNNYRWDMVDAAREKKLDIAKVPEGELPPEMRKMTPAQRTAYVEKKSKERSQLQQKIGALSAKRGAYIEAELKKNKTDTGKSLDNAIRNSVVEQARSHGFSF